MHEAGIVPIEVPSMDANRALKSLPADEQRKMKRKFRKLWRKLAKKGGKVRGSKLSMPSQHVQKACELGNKKPSRRARTARKQIVLDQIMQTQVQPALEKFVYTKKV